MPARSAERDAIGRRCFDPVPPRRRDRRGLLLRDGHGLAILAAQDNLTRIAPEEQRAEVSAAYYVCIHAGVAGPVIGVGVVAAAVSLYTAISVFAAVTGVTALVVAAWHLRHRAKTKAWRPIRLDRPSGYPRRP